MTLTLSHAPARVCNKMDHSHRSATGKAPFPIESSNDRLAGCYINRGKEKHRHAMDYMSEISCEFCGSTQH
jgi:hypothetical protein